MSELKLAVFDIDGTLVDSREVIHRAMTRAFDRAGLGEISYDKVRMIEWVHDRLHRSAYVHYF